jgi:hypothetical protein
MVATRQKKSVEQRLREALRASGKSYHQVARDIGVTNPALHYFGTRGRGLSLDTAEKLMAYLGFRVLGPGEQ